MTRDETGPEAALAATLTSDAPAATTVASAWPAAIGRFDVERKLGEGGMGVVLLATDRSLGRRVALKLLRAGADANLEGRARFLREAQVMARLIHENVVVVHEVGEHAERTFVAMEYVEGGTLTGWSIGKRWSEIVAIYLRAGRGLEAAHRAGLVHRDFKPDNVLVGADGRVRVTDFGLAGFELAGRDERAPGAAIDPAAVGLTRTGALMGTPRYMAPEQHLGEPLDARADQFSFCVALYEALFGVSPFPGSTYAEISARVINGPAPSPPADTDVPAPVTAAVLRGLARTADDRFPSMSELLAVLEAARVAPRAPRRWLAPALGLGVVVAATAVALVARSGTSSAPTETPGAAPAAMAAVIDAGLDNRAAAGDVDDGRTRIVIGDFGGDGMTDPIRAKTRAKTAAMLAKLAPELRPHLLPSPGDQQAGQAGHAFLVDVNLRQLDASTDGKVRCKVAVTVATYPAGLLAASATGGATVDNTSRALKDLDLAGADCVETVLEDVLQRQIVPFVRSRGPAGAP
jgi:predicted Ser/Thr protein kinase